MRTKEVFPTDQVPHLWANQKQEHARSTGSGNLYFHGAKIYSYGSHFCIANLIKPGVCLFTTRSYSNTTAKHISAVRYAANHLKSIYVHDPAGSVKDNLLQFRNWIKYEIEVLNNPKRRQATKDQARLNLKNHVDGINEYLSAINLTEKQVKKSLGSDYAEYRAYVDAATDQQACDKLQVKWEGHGVAHPRR